MAARVSDDALRRPRVVIADDHPEVLVAFERLLGPSCELVARALNGQQAIDAVIRLKPDIAVIDLMMPDIDGLEVCRRVRHAAPDTKVVVVTAFDDTHVQAIAKEVGAVAFVPKHSASSALQGTIQRIFSESVARPSNGPAKVTSQR